MEDLPDPVPGEGEVVVDVVAAAANFPDVLLIADQYQIQRPGAVHAGERIRRRGPPRRARRRWGRGGGSGHRGRLMIGAFAEQISGPRHLGPSTSTTAWTSERAAAFGVAHRTAYLALRTVADVGPGDWVVVLGRPVVWAWPRSSWAHLLGARVLAAASTDEKLAVCREKGRRHHRQLP